MLLLLILFACSQLFQPTICPPVRKFNCGLAGQKKLEASRRNEMIKYKDFRRYINQSYTWTILDPKEYQLLAPTTTAPRIYYNLTEERCDFMRIRCMKAYLTGAVCARTIYYQYVSFTSYCAMVFHNCIARYDNVWSIAYMGYCTEVDMDKNLYVEMTYDQMSNNSRMQSMYVADSADITAFEGYAYIATRDTGRVTKTSQTRHILYYNVTDQSGKVVSDAHGNDVTVVITVPHHNVTDADGSVMTDYEGDYITITDPAIIEETTKAPEETAKHPKGTAKAPEGTAKAPKGTAKAPKEITPHGAGR